MSYLRKIFTTLSLHYFILTLGYAFVIVRLSLAYFLGALKLLQAFNNYFYLITNAAVEELGLLNLPIFDSIGLKLNFYSFKMLKVFSRG